MTITSKTHKEIGHKSQVTHDCVTLGINRGRNILVSSDTHLKNNFKKNSQVTLPGET